MVVEVLICSSSNVSPQSLVCGSIVYNYVTVPQKALDIPHWCVICLLCNEPASFITLN